MPITEDELRDMFTERSTHLPGQPGRLAAVHRRIARRQRRVRAATVLGALAATAGAAVGVPAALAGRTPAATPATHPAKAPSLAPFAGGGKLIGGAVLHSPRQGSVTVAFIPTDWRLYVQTTCPPDWPATSTLLVTVNGHPWLGGCGGGGRASAGRDQHFWTDLGVRLGKTSLLTATIVRASATKAPSGCRGTACPPPPVQPAAERPAANIAVGVYQHVPAADYPLPARPSHLQPLPTPAPDQPGLDARRVGDNGTWTLDVPAGAATRLTTNFVAPGQVRILVNGLLISQDEWWSYDPSSAEADLSPAALKDVGLTVAEGQLVTLTVEASRFDVPGWSLLVRRDG